MDYKDSNNQMKKRHSMLPGITFQSPHNTRKISSGLDLDTYIDTRLSKDLGRTVSKSILGEQQVPLNKTFAQKLAFKQNRNSGGFRSQARPSKISELSPNLGNYSIISELPFKEKKKTLYQVQNYGKAMQLPSLKNQYKSRLPEKPNLFKENKIKEFKRKESLAALKTINHHYTVSNKTNNSYFEWELIKLSQQKILDYRGIKSHLHYTHDINTRTGLKESEENFKVYKPIMSVSRKQSKKVILSEDLFDFREDFTKVDENISELLSQTRKKTLPYEFENRQNLDIDEINEDTESFKEIRTKETTFQKSGKNSLHHRNRTQIQSDIGQLAHLFNSNKTLAPSESQNQIRGSNPILQNVASIQRIEKMEQEITIKSYKKDYQLQAQIQEFQQKKIRLIWPNLFLEWEHQSLFLQQKLKQQFDKKAKTLERQGTSKEQLHQIIQQSQDQDERLALRSNINNMIKNTTSHQANKIFGHSGSGDLQAQSQKHQQMHQIAMNKEQNSLKKFLRDISQTQLKQMAEEERLIQQILTKKPELRSTTAKFLKIAMEKDPKSSGLKTQKSQQQTITSFNKTGGSNIPSEAQRLQNQLQQFYEKVKARSKNNDDDDQDIIFGKRSEKELQFLKKLEMFNQTDQKQIAQLEELDNRWKSGIGGKNYELLMMKKQSSPMKRVGFSQDPTFEPNSPKRKQFAQNDTPKQLMEIESPIDF